MHPRPKFPHFHAVFGQGLVPPLEILDPPLLAFTQEDFLVSFICSRILASGYSFRSGKLRLNLSINFAICNFVWCFGIVGKKIVFFVTDFGIYDGNRQYFKLLCEKILDRKCDHLCSNNRVLPGKQATDERNNCPEFQSNTEYTCHDFCQDLA